MFRRALAVLARIVVLGAIALEPSLLRAGCWRTERPPAQ